MVVKEFRVFLPVLPASASSSTSWLATDLALETSYKAACDAILSATRDGMDEERSDVYFLGDWHYGLKYRNKKKLEVKVLLDAHGEQDPFFEVWEKYPLGKKEVHVYQNDIHNYIQQSKFSSSGTSPPFHQLTQIEVLKKRSKTESSLLCVETGYLQIVNTPGCGSDWITISLEGDSQEMQRYLRSASPLLTLVLTALDIATQILEKYGVVAAENLFVPMVAGYPKWLLLFDAAKRLPVSQYLQHLEQYRSHLQR